PVRLRDRALAPGPGLTSAARLASGLLLRRAGAAAGRPQRADPRPQRLLSVLGPHGAAPRADAAVSAAAHPGPPGVAGRAAGAPARRSAGGAGPDPSGGGSRDLHRHHRRLAPVTVLRAH